MSTDVNATFAIDSWEEQGFDEEEGTARITRATVRKSFSGDIAGQGVLEYLMAYADDGSASFVGLERVRGTVAGRTGTFVLRHVGTFADGAARATVTVAPGSGTGDVAGLTGEGDFLADPAGSMRLSLTFP